MIKVFYDGYAKKLDFDDVEKVKIGLPHYRDDFFNCLFNARYSDYFYIFDIVELRRFEGIGKTPVEYLDFGDSEFGHFALRITDKDGNPAPIEIIKGQDAHQENGNALRLIFDDAPQQKESEEKPINENERITMLKIIYGMAIDGYGYDANKKRNDATGNNKNSISSRLALLGGDFNVSDDTIRKYLNEAKELFESKREIKCTPKN